MNPATAHDLPFSAAADRNRQPIFAALQHLLPTETRVLEIASGTGQHAAHAALAHPGWVWQPTEAEARALPAIAQRCAAWTQVLPPLLLDVTREPWPLASANFDAVYCANLLHIAPWPVCAALMHGAAAHLAPAGHLVLYGPYVVEGEPTVPSNQAFDADLRRRNPAWGLRPLGDVVQQAALAGLHLEQCLAMPANNLLLVFGRR